MALASDDYSPSVRRVLDLPRPSWRGRMHRWMVPVAVGILIWLVVVAEPGTAKVVGAIYGLVCVGLYTVSALAHLRVWEPERLHLLFQFDHSMIMVFIAGSTAPMAYAIGGGTGWLLLGGMVFAPASASSLSGCRFIRLAAS